MNNDVEEEIARTLRVRSNDVADARLSRIADTAVRKGHRLRRRRRAVATGVAAACLAGIAVAVMVLDVWSGSQLNLPAGPSDRTTTSPSPTTSPPPSPEDPLQLIREQVVPCTEVALPPPPVGSHPSDLYDSTHFAEEGILTIYFTVDGENFEFTFNYRDDPTCRENPELERLIEDALEAAADMTVDD